MLIEHKRDRLNGQWWTVSYGKDANGEFISGVEKPYFSQQYIENQEILVKNRPEFRKKINSLNQSIEKTNQRIKELSEFHHTFNSITAREYNNWVSPPGTYDRLLDGLTWTTCVDNDADSRWESGRMPQLPYKKEPELSLFLMSIVPKEILDKENAYRRCFTTLANIRTENNQLEQEINEIAKQELNQYAYSARKGATIAWFSLVAVSFLCGGLYFKKYSTLKNPRT
ncbi:hypothetical protein SPSYN_03021 [Sporotomaculum syntrophicum]|uniref:Uncharacterized protein n=1 Tax=Sporotomaculum syntrophicum TaxID=182264 RepID=A0A9D2WM11_9FIRM|nr:hypothetical protein [Sporotomaculum syntrophicum]KAF1083865.1 hypothetical protein SPSYN_03021 [Sporotomaculum syntrophicum]